MITNPSKLTVGIGAAVGVVGATAATWVAVAQGGSSTAGTPVQIAQQRPPATLSSDTASPAMPDMQHMGVLRAHPRTSAATSTSTEVWITPTRIRAIAARAGGGAVQDIGPGDVPGRVTYDVTVVRADGSDVTVVVDAHSGAVLARQWSDQDAPTPPDPQPADGAQDITTDNTSGD
jgi:uncharacterized membrane protein YkoI